MSEPIDLLEALRVSMNERWAKFDEARAEREAARAAAPADRAETETEESNDA